MAFVEVIAGITLPTMSFVWFRVRYCSLVVEDVGSMNLKVRRLVIQWTRSMQSSSSLSKSQGS